MAVNKRFSSIHSRLLFTTLLPLTLLCIVLASYMVSSQRTVLLTNLKNIGSIAVQQVSSNAEFALYSDNKEMLRDLGESVLDIPSVKGVTFYNSNQKSHVTIGHFDLSVIKDKNHPSFASLHGIYCCRQIFQRPRDTPPDAHRDPGSNQ